MGTYFIAKWFLFVINLSKTVLSVSSYSFSLSLSFCFSLSIQSKQNMLFSYRKRKYIDFAMEFESLTCDVIGGVKLTLFGSKAIYFFMFPQITYISFAKYNQKQYVGIGSFGLSRTHTYTYSEGGTFLICPIREGIAPRMFYYC